MPWLIYIWLKTKVTLISPTKPITTSFTAFRTIYVEASLLKRSLVKWGHVDCWQRWNLLWFLHDLSVRHAQIPQLMSCSNINGSNSRWVDEQRNKNICTVKVVQLFRFPISGLCAQWERLISLSKCFCLRLNLAIHI